MEIASEDANNKQSHCLVEKRQVNSEETESSGTDDTVNSAMVRRQR